MPVRGLENTGWMCPEHLLNANFCSRCHPPSPGTQRDWQCGWGSRVTSEGFVLGEQNGNRGPALNPCWVGSCSTEKKTVGHPGRLLMGLDLTAGKGVQRALLGHRDWVGIAGEKHRSPLRASWENGPVALRDTEA